MISGNHVREELEKAEKLLNSIKDTSLEAVIKLLKLITKLATVIIKIVINTRSNTKKIMDKLDIKEYSVTINSVGDKSTYMLDGTGADTTVAITTSDANTPKK